MAAAFAGSITLFAVTDASPVPPAPRVPVVDEYHGVKVTDNYRWLENGSDPAVRAWSDAENAHSRAVLDHLPFRAEIGRRVTELESARFVTYGGVEWRPGALFALKLAPPKQQPFLVVLRSADDLASERVVLDPNALDAAGTTAIDFFVPSRDGRLVAVSLSRGGSENGDVHVYEAATGREVGEVVPRVNGGTAGGSVAWNADGSGFFYTRYPRGAERPAADLDFFQQIYFHQLGTATTEDRYELGRDFPHIAEVALEASEDGATILATVANGDGGEFAHYLRSRDGAWTQVTGFADRVVKAVLGPDGSLYLLSRADAPQGKLLRLPLTRPRLAEAVVIVPPGEAAIDSFLPTRTRLYVVDQLGGPSELRVFDRDGRPQPAVPILPVSAVGGLARLEGDDLLFANASYVKASAWYHFDAATGASRRTALANTHPVDFSDCEVVREFAGSRDGTRVPLNIIRRKGFKADGTAPLLLTGYGGYGVSMTPTFRAIRRLWLDQGGVWVQANLRGGGEFGEAWHHAGNLTRKQNVFDDFTAALEYVLARGYTSRDRLAVEGGSNGGLLMGAVVTQHPDRFRVCVSFVGIYDMLRVELSPNGAFNVTEFGTVKDPAQFQALYAYSPYHHVVDGTRYPPILFLTGANDPRVEPWHSRKMTARLQAADPAGTILLRTTENAGHGLDSSLRQRIDEDIDVYAFLFHELGVQFRPGPGHP
jgi:prolyl oligopeptidase